MRHARVLIVAAVLLVVGACGDDDGDATDATTTKIELGPTTTTAAPVVTTATTAAAKVASAEAAAKGLYERWKAKDKAGAAAFASDAAIEELFMRTYTGPDLEFMGCTNAGGGQQDCAYRAEGGSTHFIVVPNATTGWRVADVSQTAD